MNKTKNIINRTEEKEISFGLWICTVLFIIFLRDFFENVLSYHSVNKIEAFHFIHGPVFFIDTLLGVIILLHFFSEVEITRVSRICASFFIIILLPILVDYFIHLISGIAISYKYIFENLKGNLLYFFNPFKKLVPTYGMRVEITGISALSFLYIYIKRKNIFLSLLGSFFVFLLCFSSISLPAVLIAIFKFLLSLVPLFNMDNKTLSAIFSGSELAQKRITIVELVITLLLAAIWFWRYNRSKFDALLRNLRFSRSLHYFLLFIVGMVIYLDLNFYFLHLQDEFSLIKLVGAILAIFFAFQTSVIFNDIYDVECDKISNKSRPLAIGIFSKGEYLNLGMVYLAFSLLFALQVSDTAFMITLIFISLYFIYSAPPLRLKRFFIFSNIIVATQAVLAFFFGYLFFEDSAISKIAPVGRIAWLLFFIFTLSSSVKDLKDIEGDKASAVYTLPVLLGESRSRKVIGFLVFLSYLSTPFFLSLFFNSVFNLFLSFAFIFGIFNYFYLIKRNGEEKIIFSSYFIYVFLILIFLGLDILSKVLYTATK